MTILEWDLCCLFRWFEYRCDTHSPWLSFSYCSKARSDEMWCNRGLFNGNDRETWWGDADYGQCSHMYNVCKCLWLLIYQVLLFRAIHQEDGIKSCRMSRWGLTEPAVLWQIGCAAHKHRTYMEFSLHENCCHVWRDRGANYTAVKSNGTQTNSWMDRMLK